MLKSFGRGLSVEQQRALASTQAVSILNFAGAGTHAVAAYRQALALTAALALETGGLLWDEEARLLFSPEAWSDRQQGWSAGLPDVTSHLSVHAYRDGELIRIITLGMRKFALPDVVVNQVASSNASMVTLVNLFCQRLVEGGIPEKAGTLTLAVDDVRHEGARAAGRRSLLGNAKPRAHLQLVQGKIEEGDPENRLIEIAFPGSAKGLQERHAALLREFFGSEDEAKATQHDDELLAASARAKKAVLKYKPRYAEAPPLNERLLVKAPFVTESGGNEWMWVEVVRWQGAIIRGVLQNDPFEVPGLKAGARVEVQESSIFDYILRLPDGTEEGNETGALIERRQKR